MHAPALMHSHITLAHVHNQGEEKQVLIQGRMEWTVLLYDLGWKGDFSLVVYTTCILLIFPIDEKKLPDPYTPPKICFLKIQGFILAPGLTVCSIMIRE